MANIPNLKSTKSFATAAWLVARGHEVTVEERPEGVFYFYSPTASGAVEEFYAAKNKLNAIQMLACSKQ